MDGALRCSARRWLPAFQPVPADAGIAANAIFNPDAPKTAGQVVFTGEALRELNQKGPTQYSPTRAVARTMDAAGFADFLLVQSEGQFYDAGNYGSYQVDLRAAHGRMVKIDMAALTGLLGFPRMKPAEVALAIDVSGRGAGPEEPIPIPAPASGLVLAAGVLAAQRRKR